MPSESASVPPSPAPVPVPMLDLKQQNGPLLGEIQAAIADVCDSGRFVHGPPCQAFEEAMAEYCQVPHAIGCASGSDALLLALMALDIGPGHEVLLPSFTFFATAGAVWRLGARPVFVDIDPHTFNIDPARIERLITKNTKAVVPVHLFGRCADMSSIRGIAESHGLAVVEDVAQALGAEHQGRRAGSMGTIGCLSFYPTKNLGGFGDGGMLTTNDDSLADHLRVLRDHGQHPQYHHAMVGINSRLDSIQAAVLHIKLQQLDHWTAQRQENARCYQQLFADSKLDKLVTLPGDSNCGRHVWNQYTIRVDRGRRDALREYLDAAGVGTAVYYPVPLHLQRCFESLGYEQGDLPETERAAREVLSLPNFPELTESQQRIVVEEAARFFEGVGLASAAA